MPASERARLLALVPDEGLDRGVWVLEDPASPTSPGTPLDPLLPTEDADLLVEAPGPLALLTGVPAGARLPDLARREGDLVVLAEPGSALGDGLPSSLGELATTTAPVAWSGRTSLGPTLLTLDGDRLRVVVERDVTAQVATGLTGSLPGSPGRRWSDLLVEAVVELDDERTTLTARVTDALPPRLLRQLVDARALPPGA